MKIVFSSFLSQVVYGVNVTGEKHEITGARVLTLHWFIEFPGSPELERAYLAFREKMNQFWKEKEDISPMRITPHK